MIRPALQDEAFLRDVAAAPPAGLHVWWLGQSGFLIRHEGRGLLFDPYLSDSLTRKYAATDKPHVRMTERVVAPERLSGVDVATASHAHTDHLDGETLRALAAANREMTLVFPESCRAVAKERSGLTEERLCGLDAGGSVDLGGWTFHAVPAAHNDLAVDQTGRQLYLGYVAEIGSWTIYHAGDTLAYEGMEGILRRWRIDLAILPINGNQPERRVAGNLNGTEAARLARAIGARWAVPCHFEMFEFNTASPEAFEAACREAGQGYRVLRAGERWTLPA